jgi:hypothetical protein
MYCRKLSFELSAEATAAIDTAKNDFIKLL